MTTGAVVEAGSELLTAKVTGSSLWERRFFEDYAAANLPDTSYARAPTLSENARESRSVVRLNDVGYLADVGGRRSGRRRSRFSKAERAKLFFEKVFPPLVNATDFLRARRVQSFEPLCLL
jgi:hypothetical protein